MTPNPPLTFMQAIAREEGFYSDGPPNRPQRNNNPGDLVWRPWMEQFGSHDGDPLFAIFPDVQQGFAALRHLLQLPLYKGKTISQAISIYAPAAYNDTQRYVLNVCSWTEKTPDTVIDGIIG